MIVSINESAGDTKIVKAVVLKPGYSPKSLLPKKVFKYDVHAVYNSYILNKYTRDVSKGTLMSHSDIVDKCSIDESSIIGYFTKEGTEILEYELDGNAYKFLSDEEVEDIEKQLKLARW